MNNNIVTLSYTYAKYRPKNHPEMFCQIAHISGLITCIPSGLSWTPALQGRYQSILRPSFPKAITGTNNQEGPTVFDTSTRYMLWYSGCTHSINPYFGFYTEYKLLVKQDDTEVNGIGGIINPNGICTLVLDLEDDTVKIHNLTFKQIY